jgi:hypothetical protein
MKKAFVLFLISSWCGGGYMHTAVTNLGLGKLLPADFRVPLTHVLYNKTDH